jgi:poly(3-hydroxybutyrate) depolymerase
MNSLKSLGMSLCIMGCLSAYAYDGTGTVNSGGLSRTFIFHSPGTSAPPANLPLMIVMHGDGGNGASVKGYTGMDAVADAQNFIAVYPDAAGGSWNRYADNVPGDAGLGNASAPDDVQFISDMIAYFCTTYHINSQKVYATGHSAGGFMAYNLAIQLHSKIAAIAPVAGSLWGDNAFITNHFANAYTPVPVYHIHGDADGTVTYPDANHTPDAWGEWPLSGFANATCGNNTYGSSTTLVTNVKKLSFCSSGKEVTLIRIMGGGHGWPAVSGYDAASAIWNFCNSYSITAVSCNLPTSLSAYDSATPEVSIYPNPSTDVFTIQSEKEIYSFSVVDMTGKIIAVEKMSDKRFYLNSEKGLYFAVIRHSNGTTTHIKLVLN